MKNDKQLENSPETNILEEPTELDLSFTPIGEEEIKRLSQNSKLTSLNLKNDSIGDKGATLLSCNRGLTFLDLELNKIGLPGLMALSYHTTLN